MLDDTRSRGGRTFGMLAMIGFRGGDFEIVCDDLDTRVLLRVTETVTAIPETATPALWLGGRGTAGCLAAARARRKAEPPR